VTKDTDVKAEAARGCGEGRHCRLLDWKRSNAEPADRQRAGDALGFGDGEDGDGAVAEGLFASNPANACWDLKTCLQLGRRRWEERSCWKEAGLPAGLLLQLLPCKGLQVSRYLNNSDKTSVTMATRENKLIREVSDIRNA